MLKRSELTRDTERLFEKPAHVLENEELDVEDKIRVLENWKLDLLELQRASEENMTEHEGGNGATGDRLKAVNEALALLRRQAGQGGAGR